MERLAEEINLGCKHFLESKEGIYENQEPDLALQKHPEAYSHISSSRSPWLVTHSENT